MKKKALELLKEKYAGVADAVLTRVAAKVADGMTDETALAEAVEKVTFQQVLESYGDARANEAQQTAVTNYEKKHKLKDGKPVDEAKTDEQTDKQDENVPAWAKALIEANKALKGELDAMKGRKLSEDRKSKLSEITKALPEKLRKAYDRIAVDTMSDEDFDALKDEVAGEVASIADEIKAKGGVFGTPTKGGASRTQQQTEEATDAEVDDVMKRLNF